MKYKVWVIHGRFQWLHLWHIEYLLAWKQRCDFLYIWITNPDEVLVKENINDLNRSNELSNPFTYFERLEMIRDAMLEYWIKREKFEIVPFPINFPKLIKFYTPIDAIYFMTIYDEWWRYKYKELLNLWLRIEVMWEKDWAEKPCTWTKIRELIYNDEDFSTYVPKSVYTYIKENKIDIRMKTLIK